MPYNTGNPIPSSDAKDLSDNAESLDNSVNTALDTWTDRLGVERRTIQGQLKLLGYTAPDVYSGGLVFTVADNMATIERNKIIYAPLPSAVPFTTSGTWTADDEDKFFVVQGLTTENLNEALEESDVVVLAANTVADMKTKDLQPGQIIRTKVNNTTSNAGGATYLIQTAAEFGGVPDEYGDHTLANGNVAVLQVDEEINAMQFGAIPNGSGNGAHNDAVILAALTRAYNTNRFGSNTVIFPITDEIHYFDIESTIPMGNFQGVSLKGTGGKRGIRLRNNVNSNGLITTAQQCLESNIENISLLGNALTLFGLKITGPVEDGVPDGSARGNFDGLVIEGIGAGAGLEVNAWSSNFGDILIQNCEEGLRLGQESNATSFKHLNVNSCNSGIIGNAGVNSNSSVLNFETLIVQNCGDDVGSKRAINLLDFNAINITTLYTESNNALETVIFDGCTSVNIDVFHTVLNSALVGTAESGITLLDCVGGSISNVSLRDNGIAFNSAVKLSGSTTGVRIDTVNTIGSPALVAKVNDLSTGANLIFRYNTKSLQISKSFLSSGDFDGPSNESYLMFGLSEGQHDQAIWPQFIQLGNGANANECPRLFTGTGDPNTIDVENNPDANGLQGTAGSIYLNFGGTAGVDQFWIKTSGFNGSWVAKF